MSYTRVWGWRLSCVRRSQSRHVPLRQCPTTAPAAFSNCRNSLAAALRPKESLVTGARVHSGPNRVSSPYVPQRTSRKMALLLRLTCAAFFLWPALAVPTAAKDTYGPSPLTRSLARSTQQACRRRSANAHITETHDDSRTH